MPSFLVPPGSISNRSFAAGDPPLTPLSEIDLIAVLTDLVEMLAQLISELQQAISAALAEGLDAANALDAAVGG